MVMKRKNSSKKKNVTNDSAQEQPLNINQNEEIDPQEEEV